MAVSLVFLKWHLRSLPRVKTERSGFSAFLEYFLVISKVCKQVQSDTDSESRNGFSTHVLCKTPVTAMFPLAFVVVLLEVVASIGPEQIEVFKMLQYEKNSLQFGSLRSSFNLVATTFEKLDAELTRYVVLVPLANFSEAFLQTV